MQINPIQQNNQPVFGYQIKKNKLMLNVFKYNRELLREKNFNSVAKFCEAMTNIYQKTPRKENFICKGEVRMPWESGIDENSLALNVIVKSPDDFSVISSVFRFTNAHLNGKRDPYKDADMKLVRVANDQIIREGQGAEFKSKLISDLAEKWKIAKTDVEKNSILSALDRRMEYLESKMF